MESALTRTSFALFIATAGPGREAAAARATAGEEVVEAVRERWSGRVLGLELGRAEVEAVLGPADERGEDTLAYHLPGFERHLFTFAFDERGRQRRAAFQRRGPAPPMPPPPAAAEAPDDYLRTLAALGVTEDELVALLGPPLDRIGWWPSEELTFANGWKIELRHGVVLLD